MLNTLCIIVLFILLTKDHSHHKNKTSLWLLPSPTYHKMEYSQTKSLAACAQVDSTQHAVSDFKRPIANFRPCIWGHLFLKYDSESMVLHIFYFACNILRTFIYIRVSMDIVIVI
ncbi:hypothetical protein MtrunA17_Chr2g0319061 [Medicago truncatula]|uniref:Transmembrane protein n=1 Tax=Medicago truncatula TaxID=3880 RepID=A0A396JFV2_MEDTR|nr:hypothetical protein MtrunA17_Chr2g0319061 [Medicago truncatula]